jgi:type II secretory pathway pseudopilin PulG
MNEQKGFTLLEVLIIAIVLSLIASVVMPQISQAASEAKVSGLCKSLQKVRTAISVFMTQHDNRTPGSGDCDFITAITSQTDQHCCLVKDQNTVQQSSAIFGPYLFDIPKNPYNGLSTVDTQGTPGDNSHGWFYDTQTGKFYADDCPTHCEI